MARQYPPPASVSTQVQPAPGSPPTAHSSPVLWQPGGSVLEGVSGNAYFQKLDHYMVMTMSMTGMNGMPMTSTTDAIHLPRACAR